MLSAKIGYFRPRGFDPRSISGLASWWDASDASTITTVSGAVSEWRDKVGSRHLIQNTALSRPTYTANYYQGLPAVDFDGSNDSMVGLSLPSLAISPLTLICCIDSTVSNAATDRGVVLLATSAQTTSYNSQGGLQLVANSLGRGSIRRAFEVYARAASGGLELETTDPSTSQPVGKRIMTVTANGTTGRLFQSGAQFDSQPASVATSTDRVYFGSLLENNAPQFFFSGGILEVCVYSGQLTDADRLRVELYLATKWGAPVAPQVSNADAQSWINRVYANGGEVSTSTASAVNDFCNAIDAAGIRDRFYRLNLFAGTGLSACLVPLYRGQSLGGTQFGNATDTNVNFAAGDYVETGSTGGLKGNGSSKYLSTGVTFANAPLNSITYSAYASSMETSGSSVAFTLIGNLRANAGFSGSNLASFWNFGTGMRRLDIVGASGSVGFGPTALPPAAFVSAGHTGGTGYAVFSNGASVATASATITNTTVNTVNPITVFARNTPDQNSSAQLTPFVFTSARLASYHIGTTMSAAQQSAFYAAIQAFQTALGRQV